MYIRALLLSLAAALVGCQTYTGDEDSPYYAVPAGSRITLNQELRIPAGYANVYIQNGSVLTNAEVQHYYPFCKFDLVRPTDAARTLTPDEMIVTRTVQHETGAAYTQNREPIRVAALSFRLAQIGGGEGGAPPLQSFSTRMDLRSEKQPDIFRLTCAQWGYPGQDRHVTIAEIRRTLGDVFTLRIGDL